MADEMLQIRAQIAFGLDVEQFMGSSIGRYLQARANSVLENALDGLKDVDPENPKEIRRLQNEAKCAEYFLLWMGEAVEAGKNAEHQFIEGA